MNDTLIGFALIEPKPEHFADARAAIRAIQPATLAEPGCHQFVLHADEDAGLLYLYEEWADAGALATHHAQDYTKAVFASYEHWLAAPVRFETMARLA